MDQYNIIPVLRRSFSVYSTETPEGYSLDNASQGHCHVVALIMKQIYGGKIFCGLINGETLHYWNVIDGIAVDLTIDQFEEITSITDIYDATDEKINDTTREKTLVLLQNAKI